MLLVPLHLALLCTVLGRPAVQYSAACCGFALRPVRVHAAMHPWPMLHVGSELHSALLTLRFRHQEHWVR